VNTERKKQEGSLKKPSLFSKWPMSSAKMEGTQRARRRGPSMMDNVYHRFLKKESRVREERG
jgi:hypothetical protein